MGGGGYGKGFGKGYGKGGYGKGGGKGGGKGRGRGRGSHDDDDDRRSAGPSAPAQPRGFPAPSQHEDRGRTWDLYFAHTVDGSGFRTSDGALFGDEDVDATSDGQDRTSILARIDRFLSLKNIVRAAVHDPMDIVAADHTLYLSWADLVQSDPSDPTAPAPFAMCDRQPQPQLVLDCLAYLAHEDLLALCPPAPDPAHTADRLAARRLRVRIYERSGPGVTMLATPICDLKSDKIGRLVKVRGNVIRASGLRPFVEAMEFTCPRCKEKCALPLIDGRYQPPEGCPSRGCRVKGLLPEHKSAVTRDFQKVRLQETPEDNFADFYGRVPRTVEVELLDDLVDTCRPGDSAVVVGIVKSVEVQTDGGGFGRGASAKPKCMFLLYIEAVAVHNATATNSARAAVGEEVKADASVAFSARDLREIAALHSNYRGQMFELLAASFCPTIFGHEVVKVGLALGLFGGSRRALASTNDAVGKRPDIHVLVVGDPGMGKSQMLTAAAGLAPRGVYVCGNTTSSSGLTVTVVKDASGDFALEAGALVMGDQGCCCIDEFDKMGGGQHQALLEAMEQQSISVAKAGIVCSLSARTAVLAAANPISGHYNSAKTVCENLKLPSNILSRFDLVFVLLDRPNERMDKLLSSHVMALHAGAAKPGANLFGEPGGGGGGGGQFAGVDGYDAWAAQEGVPLAQRLREAASKFTDGQLLPPPLLRKYIAYARAHVHPTLTSAARLVLDDFYLQASPPLLTLPWASPPILTLPWASPPWGVLSRRPFLGLTLAPSLFLLYRPPPGLPLLSLRPSPHPSPSVGLSSPSLGSTTR